MPQFLKIFLLGLVCLVAVVGSIALWGYIELRPMTQEANRFSVQTITDFTQDWDWNKITAHGHDKWKESLKDKDLPKLAADMKSQLGALKSIKDSDCSINVNYTDGKHTFAQCYANADFEKDTALVTMTMEKVQGEWQIIGINFNRNYVKNKSSL